MAELSDGDRAAILASMRKSIDPSATLSWIEPYDGSLYLAGKAAGIAEGLEMAAKVCEEHTQGRRRVEWSDDCAAAIRALKT